MIKAEAVLDENWTVLKGLLPENWETLARTSGAISQRLRSFDNSLENVLRTLLLHVGRGYSLRETSVRAAGAGIAQASDVAILARLRKAQGWFKELCLILMKENALASVSNKIQCSIVDSSIVKESGKTGSSWRVHYSISLPDLEVGHFEITSTKGEGAGEDLCRFPVKLGEHFFVDAGFAQAKNISHVHSQGGRILVRLNYSTLPLFERDGQRFNTLHHVNTIKSAGEISEWKIAIKSGETLIPARLCILRKSEQQIIASQKRKLTKASKNNRKIKPETLEYAKYVMLVTTFRREDFSAEEVLERYRVRWQIELIFKRLKSLLQLGHIPKHDKNSTLAWLYGKLLVSLLADKLARLGRAFSPCGYRQMQS